MHRAQKIKRLLANVPVCTTNERWRPHLSDNSRTPAEVLAALLVTAQSDNRDAPPCGGAHTFNRWLARQPGRPISAWLWQPLIPLAGNCR
jgi:hypothetical protein